MLLNLHSRMDSRGFFRGFWNVLSLLYAFLLCPLLAMADVSFDRETVVIAAEDSWPPFSDRNGRGISYDIAKAALATQGYDIKTIVVPYARALKLARHGSVDACWNVTRQSNTEKTYHFGEEPLLQADISYYYASGSKNDYEEMKRIPIGTRVGVVLGYEYGDQFEIFKNRFKVLALPSQASLLKMLKAGRLDVVFMFDRVFESIVAENKFDQADFRKGVRFYTSDIYIAFSPVIPKHLELSEALDRGLREIRKSGEYKRIINNVSSMTNAAKSQ